MSMQLTEPSGIELAHMLKKKNAKPSYREPGRKTNGFIYYLKGGHTFFFPDETFRTKPGDLLYLPYGVAYHNKLNSPDTEYYEIDFLLLENGTPVKLYDSPRPISPELAKKMLPYIEQAYRQYTSGERTRKLLCLSPVLRIIGEIRTHLLSARLQSADLGKIEKSASYLEKNYRKSTSVAELAAMSYTSVSNLELLFKKAYGMTPVAYRNTLRINHAKQLLADGAAIGEAAAQTGFRDPVYFSKLFKRMIGLPPGEYRKQYDHSV